MKLTYKTTNLLSTLLTSIIASTDAQAALPKLLLMTKTSEGAYRHASIPAAVNVISQLANGSLALTDTVVDPSIANTAPKFEVVHTEDDGPWEDQAYLSQFGAIAFVLTSDTGPPNPTSILSDKAGDSLGRYIEAGGGIIGIVSWTSGVWPRIILVNRYSN